MIPGTWHDLWMAWEIVEADLHATYGIDLDDLPDRTWRWLRTRIRGLQTDPRTRTSRATSTHRPHTRG